MASKLGDVGKLPTSNALGNVGEGQQLAQHTQNIRQHGANIAGQQIYNNPTTPAGQDAQHKWHQNNPTPKMGGLPQQQQNVQNYVDQDVVARGAGPGFAHAQARLQGQQPSAPQQSTASQHAEHNSVMADIKREGANGGVQNSRVNTINPSRPVDISGDRRRTEAANGWAPNSMDQGGANYAANGQRSAQLVKQNGPTGVPQAPLAAPTPAPVTKTTPPPAPQGGTFAPGQWNGTPGSGDPFLAKMREQGVIRPDGSLNNQAPAKVAPTGSSLSPEQNTAMAEFQAKNNARMKAEGSTRPPDDYTKLGAGEQKYVHDFNLERGNIPRPVRPPTGQVPNPKNPNKDMNDRPMVPKQPGIVPPAQPPKAVVPQQPPVAQPPPVPQKPPAPKPTGKTYQNLVVPEHPEEAVAQAPKVPPKPVEGVNKMPTISKSNPIADTVKASNNPVPVVNTPKPNQQAPAQRKPLFPRLRGRR